MDKHNMDPTKQFIFFTSHAGTDKAPDSAASKGEGKEGDDEDRDAVWDAAAAVVAVCGWHLCLC